MGISLEINFLISTWMEELVETIVRKVDQMEIPTLLKIGRTTFTESFGSLNTKSDFDQYMAANFNLQKITDEFNHPESHFYFACQEDRTVGYLKLNQGSAQTEDTLENALEIERIYVLSEFQGSGIGQLLFDKALEVARENDFERVWLGVWDKNTNAIRFYERNGFAKFATHPFKLGSDDQTDILMKLEL